MTLGLRPRGGKVAVPRGDLRGRAGCLGAAPANHGPPAFLLLDRGAGLLGPSVSLGHVYVASGLPTAPDQARPSARLQRASLTCEFISRVRSKVRPSPDRNAEPQPSGTGPLLVSPFESPPPCPGLVTLSAGPGWGALPSPLGPTGVPRLLF